MTIREAMLTDARGIAKVHVDAWRSTYTGIIPIAHLDALSYEKGTEKIARWFVHPFPQLKIFVAEHATEGIVGFASGGLERDQDPVYKGELFAIYILQRWQRGGIGRVLVKRIADHIASLRVSNMITWVLEANPSRLFYEKLGGALVRKKMIEIGGKSLEEIAFGWADISAFK